MLLSRSLLVLAPLIAFPVIYATRICPIPVCDKCLDPTLMRAPGVGFHLGLTYGTAAIRYANGTVSDVAKVMGDTSYRAQLRWYTEHPHRNDLPSLGIRNDPWARNRMLWMWLQRRINILLGRPATSATTVLSGMLKELKSNTEILLGEKIHAVGLAWPGSAHLSPEEIHDMLRYASLRLVDSPNSPGRPLGELEMNSAYGGYGFGLCKSYKDPYACNAEEDAFTEERVLHLDYTMAAFCANDQWTTTARNTYGTIRFTNWDLGRGRKDAFENDTLYWAQVRGEIQTLVNKTRPPYTQVLLTGECARDEKFLAILKDVLRIAGGKKFKIKWDNIDPVFVVARGVAEFTKRRQEGWLHCSQSEKCKKMLADAGHGLHKVEL